MGGGREERKKREKIGRAQREVGGGKGKEERSVGGLNSCVNMILVQFMVDAALICIEYIIMLCKN